MSDVPHTSGKIRYHENGDANSYAVLDEQGKWLLSLLQNGEHLLEKQRANMRRLVACWNACEGIPTDLIEQGGFAAVPVATHREIKGQLEEALDVCKALVRYQELIESGAKTGLLSAYDEAFVGAEAIVAKLKG